jgi:hypothetical protein
MHRVAMLGLIAALSCAFASQAWGQLPPFGSPVAPMADLPGASISGGGPPGVQPAMNLAANPLPPYSPVPAPAPGLFGPNSLDGASGAPSPGFGVGPQAEFPQSGPGAGAPAYVSPNPTPKAPQNLGLYRPSFPEGIEAKKLSPLPSVSVREYPYLRRGQATDRFITPAGMEMPEAVGKTSTPLTWGDKLRNLFDPLGVLP